MEKTVKWKILNLNCPKQFQVKKNYEALKQRQEEERMVQNSPPRSGEENQSVNKWEKENQETTRELLKVKDRLIEVERNVRCVLNIILVVIICGELLQ